MSLEFVVFASTSTYPRRTSARGGVASSWSPRTWMVRMTMCGIVCALSTITGANAVSRSHVNDRADRNIYVGRNTLLPRDTVETGRRASDTCGCTVNNGGTLDCSEASTECAELYVGIMHASKGSSGSPMPYIGRDSKGLEGAT